MNFNNDNEVIDFVKKHAKPEQWVIKARDRHKELNALITGKGFLEVLINRIEGLENEQKAVARKKYSKDIRDVYNRIMSPRYNVFSAAGGSVNNNLKSNSLKEKLIESLANFKGQKSIKKYLSEEYFKLADVDPNGVMFLEYMEDKDIYPTYKSINDIRYYIANGQLLDVVMFEPKPRLIGGKIQGEEIRVVDAVNDYTIIKIGNTYTVNPDKTFKHPFGQVPGFVLSEKEDTGSKVRQSSIFPIEELMKDYARDKSVLTIYKFQHGFPKEWRYVNKCKTCNGTGKNGENVCKTCNGKGDPTVNDVTDMHVLRLPREGDPVIAPNVMGFISPDIATWNQLKESLKDNEETMESTSWGTKRVTNATNETATGRYIDVQPVMNRLSEYSHTAEWVHNLLAHLTENWVNGSPKENQEYHVAYGNRFIIESQDVLLEKYSDARTKGDNTTVLDKLLNEYLWSKYQNNIPELEKALKKKEVEPYVHLSSQETYNFFGSEEAYKKVLFVKFWDNANTDLTVEQLTKDFNTYVEENKLVINNNQTSTNE